MVKIEKSSSKNMSLCMWQLILFLRFLFLSLSCFYFSIIKISALRGPLILRSTIWLINWLIDVAIKDYHFLNKLCFRIFFYHHQKLFFHFYRCLKSTPPPLLSTHTILPNLSFKKIKEILNHHRISFWEFFMYFYVSCFNDFSF